MHTSHKQEFKEFQVQGKHTCLDIQLYINQTKNKNDQLIKHTHNNPLILEWKK